jgi:hypothetical protein
MLKYVSSENYVTSKTLRLSSSSYQYPFIQAQILQAITFPTVATSAALYTETRTSHQDKFSIQCWLTTKYGVLNTTLFS